MPQRIWYDQLLLFLIPRNWFEMLLLVATSWAALWVSLEQGWISSLAVQPYEARRIVVLLLYIPALLMEVWHGVSRSIMKRAW